MAVLANNRMNKKKTELMIVKRKLAEVEVTFVSYKLFQFGFNCFVFHLFMLIEKRI